MYELCHKNPHNNAVLHKKTKIIYDNEVVASKSTQHAGL